MKKKFKFEIENIGYYILMACIWIVFMAMLAIFAFALCMILFMIISGVYTYFYYLIFLWLL